MPTLIPVKWRTQPETRRVQATYGKMWGTAGRTAEKTARSELTKHNNIFFGTRMIVPWDLNKKILVRKWEQNSNN